MDSGGYLHHPDEPFTILAQVETIEGQPVDGRTLNLSLRRWNRSDYDYNDVTQSTSLTTGPDGRANITFTIEEPGYYLLRLTGHDLLGNEISYERYVYAFDRDFSSWYGREDGGLSISADQEIYAPGDTAHLVIESGFSGPALLTLERGTTRREQPVTLTAPVTLVDVTIQEDDAPNIYVTINGWEAQDTTIHEDTWMSLPGQYPAHRQHQPLCARDR